MEQQQWETCLLTVTSQRKHEKTLLGGGKEGWSYDCDMWYYSPTGDVIRRELSRTGEIQPHNPFDRAMALLGGAGWELVSVQHGIYIAATNQFGGPDCGEVRWGNIVAYFKRPVVAGRAVNEPPLSI